MRFFTKELWQKQNDPNEAVRMQAEKEWNANCSAYQEQFAQVQKQLSPGFTEKYLSRKGLHDYTILDISVTQKDRAHSCQLKLTNGAETLRITMEGLKALQMDIVSFQHCIRGRLAWGYSEFSLTPEKNIQLSVLCDLQNELRFEFESIGFAGQ